MFKRTIALTGSVFALIFRWALGSVADEEPVEESVMKKIDRRNLLPLLGVSPLVLKHDSILSGGQP